MSMEITNNYNSVYENTYASSRKEAAKKEETKETAATQKITETAKKSSNEEYTQRLKDVESAHKYVDNFLKATGSTVICSHAYVDEKGNYCNFTVSVRKDALNEKLRKEAQENAEERIEKSREKARKNAEQLLEEKIAASKDGTIYLYDTDMKTIIEAAKEDNADKANTKQQAGVGVNLDLQA